MARLTLSQILDCGLHVAPRHLPDSLHDWPTPGKAVQANCPPLSAQKSLILHRIVPQGSPLVSSLQHTRVEGPAGTHAFP